jgi:hypothetical protein
MRTTRARRARHLDGARGGRQAGPVTRAEATRFSDEQLQELLVLLDGADSVELKLTVPESDYRSAAAALGIDPLDAHIRMVYFYDTPDLRLMEHGLVVRARRVQGRHDDSVVKLRPVVPAELPAELRKSPAFNVEVDALPGGFVCSASMKGRPGAGLVAQVAAGDAPIRKLFSKEQRGLFEAHAPAGLGLDELTPVGPFIVLKLKYTPEGFEHRMVAELWLYPDGSRILELSTKCEPRDAFRAAAESRAYLSRNGIDLTGEQATKTRRALEYSLRGATIQRGDA